MSVIRRIQRGSQMRAYIAGPMTGIPHFNFPRFNAVAKFAKAYGHEIFNPAARDIERHGGVDISAGNTTGNVAQCVEEHGFSLRVALHEDLSFICLKATALIALPGWEPSKGARAEHATAVALASEGVEVVYLSEQDCKDIELFAEELEDA